ncbi:WYL domain-containing protein [Rhodoluna sp. KAS3]|uniref:helix-turn-helix transcriptional regulator n=1 Tax=Rhodoluna sp. KAS3 TaxID=942880 RepID=UPI00222E2E4A|nr:WYL domain-containing protein [Rhodoluna sp. KAS3]BDS48959.1 hypothetical protein RKAS3_05360 [Rhodoluna sp. KAS3]
MTERESTWQPAKSDKSERLLQLTCALIFAERGLTKAEIFRAVTTYATAPRSNDDESLNRMFERDKADLRASGIKLELVDPKADAEELRYVIENGSFVWPHQVELTPKQLQILSLAAQVWAKASLKSEASQALVRLRALGIAPSAEDLIGFAPRIQTREPSFTPLNSAIDDQHEVEFDYRKPDGTVSKRHVQPWSLRNIDGQWMLQCYDLGASEARNFLLKRIVSKVKPVKTEDGPVSFEAPTEDAIQAATDSLDEFIKNNVAELKVARDSQAWFHFHLDDDLGSAPDAIVQLHYLDVHLLAEELRNFALDIEVIRPKELADAINNGFARVAADHA